jgi:septal ring factor EnvC (AmiA/AmiB activator)
MSESRRLDRLGLLHLEDDPQALRKELDRLVEEDRKREVACEAERQRRLRERREAAADDRSSDDPSAPPGDSPPPQGDEPQDGQAS